MYRIVIAILFACCFNFISADEKDDRRRATIYDFLSYYQQAYHLKDTAYISQFFSNEALILTETKKLIPAGKEIIPNSSKKRPYHTVIENKRSYITKIKDYFANNKKITLGISDKFIQRHTKFPDIYGVNFFQIWDDVGDADIMENRMPGYVFMMVDFRHNELEPTVHVRTWQPKDNIKTPYDKYKLTDFTIFTTK